ncbi:Oidioi.mRNA.OKI2018_I69.XSR.g16567.t1.cds [Oikopleura dioica]|uniref:RNA helicase n=1 Tax=Oikopleura dioica TaxID=34765 RepID=A0ABN7SGI2_OIKDI|nr:Oidioi.mRNA.OKI2018_I69.XSR.g16567.t1.cds [Oikopleura dioica]
MKGSDDKEEKQDSPGQAEGFEGQKVRTKEQNDFLDNVRKMMNPDAKTESGESTEVGDIGETTTFGKDGDDSSSDEENGEKAFPGFGSPTNKSSEDKENKDEDEDSDENENDDGDDGQISVDSDDSDAKTLKTDDMNEEEQKIWQELNCNRVYSGYICHALENEEDLHKINAPGEELKKIDSIEYRVTKAKKVEAREGAEDDAEDNASDDSKKIESVEEIPKEKYLSEDYDDLGLHEMLKANLMAYGWEAPLLVQRVGMRPIQDRQDILINAQTGSGKTGAFLIPIVNYILKNTRNKKFAKERERGETNDEIPGVGGIMGIDPRALILTPTRELAIQIAKEAVKLTRGLGRESIKVCNLYGGTKRSTQRFNAFGADIIVGTPGRVRDILFPDVAGNTRQHFDSCDFIVLDEADRMLDDGFGGISMDIIERITLKRGEQTHPISKVLTSATFPSEIQAFARKFLRPGYWYAQCGMLNAPSATVTQEVVEIGGISDKYSKLDEVLERFVVGVEDSPAKALVFANTKRTVDFLGCRLSEKLKHKCITMHGDRSQQQREFALWTFATNKCPVLIATNVAARGLDIPAVDLVVNFDCSDTTWLHDDYIHRIGRTGRVGRPGTAVTFLHKKDAEKARILLNIMKGGHAEIPDWIEELAEETPESVEDDDKKDDASSASGRLAKSTKSEKSDSPTPSLGEDDTDEKEPVYVGF